MTGFQNLEGFVTQTKRDAETVALLALRDHRALVRRTGELVVDFTPVGRGQMVANWQCRGPGLTTTGFDRNARDPAKSATRARVAAVAAQVGLGPSAWENPVPYARIVDSGAAHQSPASILTRTEIVLNAEFVRILSEQETLLELR